MELIQIILFASALLIILNQYNKINTITCVVVALLVLYMNKLISNENTYVYEKFGDSSESSVDSKVSSVHTSGKNHSIFDEDMFSDVQVFDNKLVGNEITEIGIKNCLRRCKGICTEYGITGRGLCYPSNWTILPRTNSDGSSN